MAGLATLAGMALFLLGGKILGGRGAPLLVFGRSLHVTWDPGLEIAPDLSPDGRFVAYAAGSLSRMHVMVRPVGEGRAVALTGDTIAAETDPQWSPNGSRILFLSRGGVFSAPASGGPARPEVPGDTLSPVVSAVWSRDGDRIAFMRDDTLFVRESGASLRAIARLPQAARCSWSPNGDFIACAAGNLYYTSASSLFGNQSPGWIVLARVRDGALTTVTDSLSLNHSPVWSPDGRWVYFVSNRDGPNDIYGVPIAASGKAGGPVQRLSTGLGAHTISISATGARLAYSRYTNRSSVWSLPLPASPPVTTAAATRVTNASETIEQMSVSADGKWLYYDSDLSGNADIFRLPLSGGDPEQLTTDRADDFAPDPSPDGREVVFHSWRGGSRDIYVQRLDGGGVQQVTNSPGQESLAHWSPDGKALVFTNLGAPFGIWVTRRDDAGHWGKPRQLQSGGFFPIWSPDGRTIAFTAAILGGSIRTIPADSGAQRSVVDAPGVLGWMTWAPNGLIYYGMRDLRGNVSLWSVSAKDGAPRLLVRLDPVLHPSFRAVMALGNGRIYFSSEDRESDVWVMEIQRQ